MMTTAAPIAIAQAIEVVMRNDRGRLLAALIARLRDFQLAEDALQDAAISAMTHWGRTGLPASPQGWLLRVALRKAIDRLRSGKREGQRVADLTVLAEEEAVEVTAADFPDDRLRLIFTCCHPALDAKSRVALTLRTIGGLSTPQIAAAFLDQDTTMGQRLSRAKAKIAAAGIPFAVPGPEDWPARLESVLTVIYLIFNAGYTAGPLVGCDLAGEAIYLMRMVNGLHAGDAEVEGALALLLLTHARHRARVVDGATVPPQDQDRALWDDAAIAEGLALIDAAMARGAPGPYQVKAAIAACHMQSPPDWPQIVALYAGLMRWEPSPVVALNHAVAVAESGDVDRALRLTEGLAHDLADYQPFHAAQADLLARLQRRGESLCAYDRAISGATSEADIRFLQERRAKLLN
jgi:RNA polymerase sigma factor (sigma-70 family)